MCRTSPLASRSTRSSRVRGIDAHCGTSTGALDEHFDRGWEIRIRSFRRYYLSTSGRVVCSLCFHAALASGSRRPSCAQAGRALASLRVRTWLHWFALCALVGARVSVSNAGTRFLIHSLFRRCRVFHSLRSRFVLIRLLARSHHLRHRERRNADDRLCEICAPRFWDSRILESPGIFWPARGARNPVFSGFVVSSALDAPFVLRHAGEIAENGLTREIARFAFFSRRLPFGCSCYVFLRDSGLICVHFLAFPVLRVIAWRLRRSQPCFPGHLCGGKPDRRRSSHAISELVI